MDNMKRGYLREKDELIEKRIKERLQSHESSIIQDLRKQGNIHEAAVVFSHEGFNFFIDNISRTIARELTPYIEEVVDEKINHFLTQLIERLERKVNTPPATETGKATKPERRVRWTKEEDDLLISAVNSYLQRNGGKVKDALEFVHTRGLLQRSLRSITLRYYYLKQRDEA